MNKFTRTGWSSGGGCKLNVVSKCFQELVVEIWKLKRHCRDIYQLFMENCI